MPKNPFQDMVKVNSTRKDRLVRDVVHSQPKSENKLPPIYYEREIRDEQREGGSRYGLWIIAFISVVFLIFALSFLFSKAHITIKPKSVDLKLSENLSAIKDATIDNLPFDLIAISGEENKTVEGQEQKDVLTEAKGTVVIYNTFSSSTQALDIDTRLEASNGKIYKTDVKVIVPGMKNNDTPGSVEVGIHATEPGQGYDSGPLDFKIFGFKGTPKYSKFYARSKGSISGGLKGSFYTITDVEKAKVISELKDALQAKLLNKAIEQIPDGFVLFKEAVFLKIDNETPSAVSKESQVSMNIKGTLYGFLFNEEKLTKEIIKKILPSYDGNPIHITNIEDMAFSLANKETISFKDASSIYFKISGSPKVVWDVDVEKLTNDVLEKKKKDFNQVLLDYPNIDSAKVVIRPIWKSSFPEDKEDIKISVEPF